MKKILKVLLIVIVVTLIGTAFTSTAERQHNIIFNQNSQEETSENLDIPINRLYFIAQVNGEINISETCNYTKSIIPDIYRKIEINGTVINSTIMNPFAIWPPISLIPFLRTIFLTDDSPVYLTIFWFKGKFYTKDNETKVRFYGEGLFIKIEASLKLN